MQIIHCEDSHIPEVALLFDEYRVFCGYKSDLEKTEKFLNNLVGSQLSTLFIAVDSKSREVMGFVNLYPCFSSLALTRLWILNDLGVSSRFRGRGVSKKLIQAAMNFAEETKAVRIELKTEKRNVRARQLYQSLGFEVDHDNVYYRVPF
ncbi:GNAT family N-acetyltransferase [Microbulbifer echini]|uniref:GNAT family N-acetyltransferase n=1 Tax=Microbulbifer echini TaxID=1529067 RepID=A0ABV4NRL1_9GAMM|nr:GNAT family N-acetyltransferase [uncultured Microbulbifer sp.]